MLMFSLAVKIEFNIYTMPCLLELQLDNPIVGIKIESNIGLVNGIFHNQLCPIKVEKESKNGKRESHPQSPFIILSLR